MTPTELTEYLIFDAKGFNWIKPPRKARPDGSA